MSVFQKPRVHATRQPRTIKMGVFHHRGSVRGDEPRREGRQQHGDRVFGGCGRLDPSVSGGECATLTSWLSPEGVQRHVSFPILVRVTGGYMRFPRRFFSPGRWRCHLRLMLLWKHSLQDWHNEINFACRKSRTAAWRISVCPNKIKNPRHQTRFSQGGWSFRRELNEVAKKSRKPNEIQPSRQLRSCCFNERDHVESTLWPNI